MEDGPWTQRKEEKTKQSHYGFWPSLGLVDAIFFVRSIMEKAIKRKIALNFNFIDYKAGFDTIWRKVFWKMSRSFGIGNKSVNIIEQFYDKTECVVILSGQITDWFEVKVGVR